MILRNALNAVRARLTEAERTIAEELLYSEQQAAQRLDDNWEEMCIRIAQEGRNDYLHMLQ